MKKSILDITDLNEEFGKLNDSLNLLRKRFMAIAMDYTHYIDNSFGQDEIYKLRDSIIYRFFSTRLHTELLLRQHFTIEDRFEKFLKNDPDKIMSSYFPSNPYFDQAEEEISSIFDSFLYHQVSVFDYVGTLVNYICGTKNNKQSTLKWTNLARSSRDKNSHYGPKPIASIIKDLDNKFVNKLYSYRSILIHEKAEKSRHSFTIQFGEEEKFTANFIATNRLTKQFSELRKLSIENHITTRYVVFWIMKKAIESVTQILFALKNEMMLNPKVPFGMMGYHDKETNRILPASTPWWNDDSKKNSHR